MSLSDSPQVRCLECRCTMELADLHDDQRQISYSGYRCPKCGHTVVTLEQMKAYNSARDLRRVVPQRRKIVRVGSSLGFTLPSAVRESGVHVGQEIEITVLDARRIQIELLARRDDEEDEEDERARPTPRKPQHAA